MLASIFGLTGPVLTADERAFFAECDPAGYILFGRNCETRTQLRALTDALRAIHGRAHLAILIDQEGGRVARMRPPEWPHFPSGEIFDQLYRQAPMTAMEAARINAEALGAMLCEVGITVNCLPLLDVRTPLTHPAIGDRSLGADPIQVASLGRAVLDGLAAGSVVGVVKHMPGQGRATVDSHLQLPVVSEARATLVANDFLAFQRLNTAPMGMTGHIVFEAYDAGRPATLSPIVINDVIRGEIGFDGFLMSDDLDMKALDRSVAERAAGCVAAGCDVALNCWGRMDEMIAVANAVGELTAIGTDRLDRAMTSVSARSDRPNFADLIDRRDRLLQAGSSEPVHLV